MAASEIPSNPLFEELLDFIEKGRVIPIIGPGMHTVQVDGVEVPILDCLAQRLIKPLDVKPALLPATYTIDDVVAVYLDQRKPIERVYRWVHQLLQELDPTPSQALLDLASISGFNLFVTTAFDDLLARAVRQQRQEANVLSYNGSEACDLPKSIQELKEPTVYHLFGKSSAMANEYVVTEEDMLEFLCSLQTAGRRPPRLFDALRERHLLLLGCNFSDWLARFFIRTARNTRPSCQIDGIQYFADPSTTQDQDFVLFLKRFSRHTELLTTSGVLQFASTLAAAWKQRARVAPGPEVNGQDGVMEENSVFISYPSEDREAASTIQKQLAELGIRAWLDREKLEGGDNYAEKIRVNVERSGYFLAVISKNTQTEEKRWFRKEWSWALDIASQLDEGDRFIVPVSVDETTHTAKRLPSQFRALQWMRTPAGKLTAEQKTELQRMFVKSAMGPRKS